MKKMILVVMVVMSFATGAQSVNPSGIDVNYVRPQIVKKAHVRL